MLTFTLDNDVAVIGMDDGKVNAISHDFCAQVQSALDRAEREARAVALIGRPQRFSAGFDLNVFKQGEEATYGLLQAGGALMLRLFRHPQPLIMGCTGHAIAGGALLLLTGDTRVAAAGEFKIGLNETAIGMVLPQFGLELAQHRLSPQHIQAAVIQAQLFNPEGARAAGFVDEVVPPDEVPARTVAVAQQMATIAGAAYAGNKRNLRAEALARLEASLAQLKPTS